MSVRNAARAVFRFSLAPLGPISSGPVGDEHEPELAQHQVERLVWKRESLGVRLAHLDRGPGRCRDRAGNVEHDRGKVHSDDPPGGTHALGSQAAEWAQSKAVVARSDARVSNQRDHLAGLLAGDATTVGIAPERAATAMRAAWSEVKWPSPLDQWGTGRAFVCRAADCGAEIDLYLRAKLGFRALGDSVRHATRVIAVSDWTRREIERVLGVAGDRVVVVGNGVDEQFSPGDRVAACNAVRDRWSLDRPFVLAVGTLERRKGLEVLFDAARLAAARGAPWPLVLAGAEGNHGAALAAAADALPGCRRLGPVNDHELVSLYRAADVVAAPSLAEGFGIVPLEAMACGTPVVVAGQSGALEEIGGSAAIVVGSRTAAAWVDGLDAARRDRAAHEAHPMACQKVGGEAATPLDKRRIFEPPDRAANPVPVRGAAQPSASRKARRTTVRTRSRRNAAETCTSSIGVIASAAASAARENTPSSGAAPSSTASAASTRHGTGSAPPTPRRGARIAPPTTRSETSAIANA